MNHVEAVAAIGHNSGDPVEIVAEDPFAVFRAPELIDDLESAIRVDVASMEVKLSTKAGRDAVASKAYSIAKIKTAIDAAGKEINAERRKEIEEVDKVRRKARDVLDELRDLARKPLDEWEAAEANREQQMKDARKALVDAVDLPFGITSDQVRERIRAVRVMEFSADVFRDSLDEFEALKNTTLNRLAEDVRRVEAAEAEQAELRRLREEAAVREAADRRRAEEEARQKAEAERIAAAEAKAREEAAAEERRKSDAAIAALKAEAAAKVVAEQERQRAADEAKADEEARAQDMRHRREVDAKIIAAISKQASIDEMHASRVHDAILAGFIPHVTITY